MRIYLNEYNLNMRGAMYLPLASGMIRAYAETFPEIKKKYEFMPFIFKIDIPDNIMKLYDKPDIAAFSVSLWNYNLSLEIARRIKVKYPKCIIIFGGPSVPKEAGFPIDIIIKGEGESQFVSFLLKKDIKKKEDLSHYPSPYTTGLFDYLLKYDIKFQAIIETNRGCPNFCSYCYWGHGGLDKKYRYFSIEYIKDVATWIGKNKIEYVFCADSNFGIFQRDLEIANIFVDIKNKYSYPDKFRVCYGKNASVFPVAKTLHDAGLAKAVTLSRQSTNEEVLKNINRVNISDKVFDILQDKYRDANIRTYSELILGLPGETVTSFVEGVNQSLKHHKNNNLFIYHCTVLPNTQLADKDYQKKFGIKTSKIPITETHCRARYKDSVIEYENIIVETNTMTMREWIKLAAWAWTIQLEYSLGYKSTIPNYILEFFVNTAIGVTEGRPRCMIFPGTRNIYWEPEEYALLLLSKNITTTSNKILHGRKRSKNERSKA